MQVSLNNFTFFFAFNILRTLCITALTIVISPLDTMSGDKLSPKTESMALEISHVQLQRGKDHKLLVI